MSWEKGKPRQPRVKALLDELAEVAKKRNMYIHQYNRQSKTNEHPRMKIYMLHDSPEKPSRTMWCKGPGCAFYLQRGRAERPVVVSLLERLVGSARAGLHTDFHQEVLGKDSPNEARLGAVLPQVPSAPLVNRRKK